MYDACRKIHDAGVSINEFNPSKNVRLREDNTPFIVGFKYASEHQCSQKMKLLPADKVPHEVDFGCQELYLIANDMQFMLTRKFDQRY